ncbi:MAG TPA: aminoacyl-histidine dipeptidase [Lentimicrobium sp.]|nr:aminoacyl-histidine dipeptidase [Lentimicrobium sp.]
MSNILTGIEPSRLYHHFEEICKIPRPSKKEEKIAAYLVDFGKRHNLDTIVDKTGNVIIRKPASKGMEHLKSVVLQSHIDMVCEKNSDTVHDFDKDPIQPFIAGEWIKAKGTTLGADDGIGVATQLTILESTDIPHGPIECLFTVDEETGLTGAFGLDTTVLKSSILLNLDSEDEGEIFIGCAGGIDTVITLPCKMENINKGAKGFKIKVSGLKGGHSGDDINKGLGNANKILNRLLWEAEKKFGLKVSSFNAGNLRNAIAREGEAIVAVNDQKSVGFIEFLENYELTVKAEYKITEPDLKVEASEVSLPEKTMSDDTQHNLLNSLYACPHGVIAMSASIPNFVETSTNLAAVRTRDETIEITTSQRSSVESAKYNVANMVAAVFNLAGGISVHGEGYPGWTPNPQSEILEIAKSTYEKLFGYSPKVLAIHAGLECGLIGEKYPEMDMISYGPTIKGAHSPDERLNIETVRKFWDFTLEILKNVPKE